MLFFDAGSQFLGFVHTERYETFAMAEHTIPSIQVTGIAWISTRRCDPVNTRPRTCSMLGSCVSPPTPAWWATAPAISWWDSRATSSVRRTGSAGSRTSLPRAVAHRLSLRPLLAAGSRAVGSGGRITGQPCWKLLGGLSNRVRAYASSGTLRDPGAMAEAAERYLARGFPALKLRFRRGDWRDDVRALEAVRARIGNRLELDG